MAGKKGILEKKGKKEALLSFIIRRPYKGKTEEKVRLL